MLASAILAGRMIAQQNIFPRKGTSLEWYMDVFRQPDHRRCVNRQFCRMKHVAIVLFRARDAFEDHYYCAPLIAHIDRLERCIQN